MTLLHQAAQKAVEAVPRFRWDQDMDVLAGPYPDGEWVRRSDVIAALQQQPEPVAPIGWLYDWTHSSALGKPDEQFTGFTTDEAHARKHDNPRAVYTAPALQHQEVPREPVALTDKQIQDAVFAVLRKWNTDRAWERYTRESGPYDVSSLRPEVLEIIRAVLAASPSTTRQQEVGSEPQDCPVCKNGYLAIRTDTYKDGREFVYCDCCGCMADRRVWNRIAAAPSTPEKAGGVPAFDPTQPCLMQSHTLIGPAPTMTYCQRCKNPHHACDGGVPSPIPHPLPAQANDGGEHG